MQKGIRYPTIHLILSNKNQFHTNIKVMQKIILCVVLFTAAISLTACYDSDEKLVQERGEDFIAALMADNFPEYRTMVTPETFDKWATTAYPQTLELPAEEKAKLQANPPEVSDVKVNGRKAQATLSTGLPSEQGEITILHFRKIGRVWFVDEPGIRVEIEGPPIMR